MKEPCEHNEIILHGWFFKFKLWRACIYCGREVQYPGTYWTRKGMEVAARPLKRELADAYMDRLQAKLLDHPKPRPWETED